MGLEIQTVVNDVFKRPGKYSEELYNKEKDKLLNNERFIDYINTDIINLEKLGIYLPIDDSKYIQTNS